MGTRWRRNRIGWVAVALAGGLLAGSGCAAETPSLRERLVQDLRSDPEYSDYSDKQVECVADAFVKYVKPEAIEQVIQGQTPAGSGWKDGVDGRTVTSELAACGPYPLPPSTTG
ncbi:hypothetical protein [Nonomuraea rosea]